MPVGPQVGIWGGPVVGSQVGIPAGRKGLTKTLIVIMGQSNAGPAGDAAGLSAANQQYAVAYPAVKFMSRTDGNTDPPVEQNDGPISLNTIVWQSANKLGFECSLMRDLDRASPGGFACCRFGFGSTNSANWLPTGTYPLSITSVGGPNLYQEFVAYAKACMAVLGCSSIGAFVWEQGEADGLSAGASGYGAFLTTLVTALRVSFPGIPFVFGQLNAEYNEGSFGATIVAQQQAFQGTMTKTSLVVQDSVTIELGLYDGTHYNANGMVAVGHLFSPVVASYIGVSIPPLPSFTFVPTSLSVTFTDTSIAYGTTVTAWSWTFGDGGTSTVQSPTHVYAGSGTYTVTLKVTDGHGRVTTSGGTALTVAASIAGVTRDATSGIYCPASATEWTTFLADPSNAAISGLGNPNSVWLMDAASGNQSDAVGALTLTALGSPTYANTVTGWTRKGIEVPASGTSRMAMAAATGPNPTTTNSLWIWFMQLNGTPAASLRTYAAVGANGAVEFRGAMAASATVPEIRLNATDYLGVNNPVALGIGPWTLQYDRTNSRAEATTPQEAITATYVSTVADGVKGWGACGGTSLDATCVYGFMYSGANASMSRANLKLLLKAMGWTIPWT